MTIALAPTEVAISKSRDASSPLDLALAVLPHLRGGLTPESADWTARLLLGG